MKRQVEDLVFSFNLWKASFSAHDKRQVGIRGFLAENDGCPYGTRVIESIALYELFLPFPPPAIVVSKQFRIAKSWALLQRTYCTIPGCQKVY
jgi:hypothetical protein